MRNTDSGDVPRVVTLEGVRAVCTKDLIYEAGALVMLQLGIWKLQGTDTPQEAEALVMDMVRSGWKPKETNSPPEASR